jgi:hypothetical protein
MLRCGVLNLSHRGEKVCNFDGITGQLCSGIIGLDDEGVLPQYFGCRLRSLDALASLQA